MSEIIRGETLIDANASNLARIELCPTRFSDRYESRRDCKCGWNGMEWNGKRMIRYMRVLLDVSFVIETLREITINNMAGRNERIGVKEGRGVYVYMCVVWNFSIDKPALSLRPFIRSCLGRSGRGIVSNGLIGRRNKIMENNGDLKLR